VYYREAPPAAPRKIEPLIVRIPGKKLPPPPRKVIIEILPKIPTKPQPIILERWLTPKPVKRRVVYEKGSSNQNQETKSDKPEIIVNKKYYFIDEHIGLKNENEIDGLVDKLAKSSKLNKNKASFDRKKYTQSFSNTNISNERKNIYRYIEV